MISVRGKKFLVKFNYIPVNVDELELKVGDVVELISEIEEGWWEGKLNNKVRMKQPFFAYTRNLSYPYVLHNAFFLLNNFHNVDIHEV